MEDFHFAMPARRPDDCDIRFGVRHCMEDVDDGADPARAEVKAKAKAKGKGRGKAKGKGKAKTKSKAKTEAHADADASARPAASHGFSVVAEAPSALTSPPQRPLKRTVPENKPSCENSKQKPRITATAAASAAPAPGERFQRLESENARLKAELEQMRIEKENLELRAQLEQLRGAASSALAPLGETVTPSPAVVPAPPLERPTSKAQPAASVLPQAEAESPSIKNSVASLAIRDAGTKAMGIEVQEATVPTAKITAKPKAKAKIKAKAKAKAKSKVLVRRKLGVLKEGGAGRISFALKSRRSAVAKMSSTVTYKNVSFPPDMKIAQQVPVPQPRAYARRQPSDIAATPCDKDGPAARDVQPNALPAFSHRLQKKAPVEDGTPITVLLRRFVANEDLAGNATPTPPVDVALDVSAESSVGQRGSTGKGRPRKGGEGRGAKGSSGEAAQKEHVLPDVEEDLDSEEEIVTSSEQPQDVTTGDSSGSGSGAWSPMQPVDDPRWNSAWSGADSESCEPGAFGFNVHAAACMARAGLGTSASPFAGLGLLLHQESVAFLLHPSSPVKRLLVDHIAGVGRRLIMVRIVENFFDDARPKLVLFPRDQLCDKFYQELLKWPTRWRHYFACCCPKEAALASGTKFWKKKLNQVWDLNNPKLRHEASNRGIKVEKVMRRIIDAARKAFSMQSLTRDGVVQRELAEQFLTNHRGAPLPRAPLCALLYSTAGGNAGELGKDNELPGLHTLRAGFDQSEKNPYSGKVIILGNCHHLVQPTQRYQAQIKQLREHLRNATGIVLAVFTDSLSGCDLRECKQLLDIVKGQDGLLSCDEGYVSSIRSECARVVGGKHGFPQHTSITDVLRGNSHSLHGESLKRYLLKEAEFHTVPQLAQLPATSVLAKLSNYCTFYMTRIQYGKELLRKTVLQDMKEHAPKLQAIAKLISKRTEKAVVMISREVGLAAIQDSLQKAGKLGAFKIATLDDLDAFNDGHKNLRGERFRVLVADTTQVNDYTCFRNVRRLYAVGLPLAHSTLSRWISCCARLGSHVDLPVKERRVNIEVHATHVPKLLQHGPSALIYRTLLLYTHSADFPGSSIEAATSACAKALRERPNAPKSVRDLAREVMAEDGNQLTTLLVETALEELGVTSAAPTRSLSAALKRLSRGGDDVDCIDRGINQAMKTADELLLARFRRKIGEVEPYLDALRLLAIDRPLLQSATTADNEAAAVDSCSVSCAAAHGGGEGNVDEDADADAEPQLEDIGDAD